MPRPASNPFTPNQPITEDERFFGREDVIEWVRDRFAAGERFLLIFGAPRMGKTSLLFRLRPKLAGKMFSVYLDLQALPEAPMREMLWHLVAEAHRQLLQDHGIVPELSREAFLLRYDYLQGEILPLWRRVLRGKHLALLLDGPELGRFKEGTWAELVLRLQEIVAQETDLCIVTTICGSAAQIKEPVPALRGLPHWDLDSLTEAQTEELLVGMARYQLGFDYDALRRIHVLSGGHPYLVQAFGAALYRQLAPFGQVTIHVVSDLASLVIEAAEELFAREWSALSREAQITLAASGSMQGYRGSLTAWDIVVVLRRAALERGAEAVEQSLRELGDQRVMRWLGGSAYALRVDLLRTWLASAHPLPEVLHGKRHGRRPAPRQRRSLAVDWGGFLPWLGIGLAILLVARVWSSRNARPASRVPLPTLTSAPATPRPTATRVPVPGRIAYMAQATGHDPWCIWSMRDNGTDPLRLTEGTSEDTWPAWSPDGRQLAFISNRDGNRDVWVMSADATRLENITNSPAEEWTPAWAPDGMDIAFASNRDGDWELYVAKPDGSQVRRLTRNAALDYAPAWSPDGGQLAFVSERDGNSEIYVVNRDGSDLQRLTQNQVTDLSPRWSPDGKLIVFESYRDGNMEIYTMAPDGSEPRNVSNEPESDEHGPSWSPDGKWITFYSNRDGSWDILIMLADGSQKVNLTMSTASEQAPVWQPQVE